MGKASAPKAAPKAPKVAPKAPKVASKAPKAAPNAAPKVAAPKAAPAAPQGGGIPIGKAAAPKAAAPKAPPKSLDERIKSLARRIKKSKANLARLLLEKHREKTAS